MKTAVAQIDEAAVRQVFDKLAVAWDTGDAQAFTECLTDDCDYVTFAGQHIKGRQEKEQIHHDLFTSTTVLVKQPDG